MLPFRLHGSTRGVATIVIGLHLGGPAALRAQPTLVIRVPSAAELHAEEFARVREIRELSDGRALVADSREKRVVALDWTQGSAANVGRLGDGPGEFRTPNQLLALPADTTVIVDTEARRWLVVVGSRLAGAVPIADVLRLSAHSSPVLGADAEGHVLLYHALPTVGGGARGAMTRLPFYAESLLVVRASRTHAKTDTLAGVRGRPWADARVSRGGTTYTLWNPHTVPEQALLFADGWVAIVRGDPYRVEWRSPTGTLTQGPVVDSSRVRGTTAEREFAAARVQPRMAPPRPRLDEFPPWPSFAPAIAEDALFALSDGRLAVARMPTLAAPLNRYDIVDRRGRLVARLQLQGGQRLLGFGGQFLYTVVTDEDGIERIARLPLPKF